MLKVRLERDVIKVTLTAAGTGLTGEHGKCVMAKTKCLNKSARSLVSRMIF